MKIFLIVLTIIAGFAASKADPTQIQSPKCESSKCGDIEIPFPFGIEEGCYFNDPETNIYNIKCNGGTPIFNGNVSLVKISVANHTLHINSKFAYECYNGTDITVPINRTYLPLPYFTVNKTQNKFVAIGCDTQANVVGNRAKGKNYATGCTTFCTDIDEVSDGTCSGVGCCETPIPDGVTRAEVSAWSFFNHTDARFNPCSAAIVVEKEALKFSSDILKMKDNELRELKLPTVLDWWIIGVRCDSRHVLCGANAECWNHNGGHRCLCKNGYRGNPYLSTGCHDIDECSENKDLCGKFSYCENRINGGYDCKNPTILTIKWWKALHPHVKITIGICFALIILIAGLFWVIMFEEKRKLLEMRETFFLENGGLILSQKLYGRDITSKFKIYPTKELEIATKNFSECSIVGKGGFGVVYKGIMANGQVVAIKKSLKVDPTQVEKFINEVLVVSEINNKNVVKLLGCCLETEVPLLVYEFINNGTLYEHLHDDRKAALLSWDIRLKIAKSVAKVLSYLHTTISIPVIHRDIKSMNILLDENYTAKVSDFGVSKLVPVDHGQLVTMVLGTWGYLDPEYMQTSELTEKSDVYSFGVVLVELLTRKKALSYDCPEDERCLAMNFLRKVKDDRLFDIIDEQIREIENLGGIIVVANLAKRCLAMKGEERPAMKEVARELEGIKKKESYPLFVGESETQIDECELLFIETLMLSEGSSETQFSDSQDRHLLALNDGR